MDARKLTLGVLFETFTRYSAPLYQRPYVWEEEENWVPLWEGVQGVVEKRLGGTNGRPHFLGAIVLDQLKTPTGDVTERQMIDGQQRLTTLQLPLAAARDICQEHDLTFYQDSFGWLTVNHVPSTKNVEDPFKVWPTNVDREHFRKAMTAHSPEAILESYGLKPGAHEVGHLVPDCYLFFHDLLAGLTGARHHHSGHDAQALAEALGDKPRKDLGIHGANDNHSWHE